MATRKTKDLSLLSSIGIVPAYIAVIEVQGNKALETPKLSWDSDLNIICVQLSVSCVPAVEEISMGVGGGGGLNRPSLTRPHPLHGNSPAPAASFLPSLLALLLGRRLQRRSPGGSVADQLRERRGQSVLGWLGQRGGAVRGGRRRGEVLVRG